MPWSLTYFCNKDGLSLRFPTTGVECIIALCGVGSQGDVLQSESRRDRIFRRIGCVFQGRIVILNGLTFSRSSRPTFGNEEDIIPMQVRHVGIVVDRQYGGFDDAADN